MIEVLIGASLITAFVAGIAALFAPCCITVLLPAYFGSIFRERKTVFLMTFVFFLGLLVIFLPLGLGLAGLSRFFSQYHNQLFIFGGLFLFLLGIFTLFGKRLSLPFSFHPAVKVGNNVGSVFVLGIFSGFATVCCAPVLAGVLMLSALPGSIFLGGLYAITFVLGMTLPLFVIAYFLDKIDITKKLMALNSQVSYSFFGKKINLARADIVSGTVFSSMGIFLIYLALTSQLVSHSSYQMTINAYSAKFTNLISQYLAGAPAIIFIIIVVAFLLLIFKIAFQKYRKRSK